MATLGRVLRACRRFKTLNPPHGSSGHLLRRLTHHSYYRQICSNIQSPLLPPRDDTAYSMLPAILASFFGAGIMQMAYSDSDQVDTKPSESPSSYKDLEEIAKKERERIESLLKSKGVKYGSYPRFTVAVKGQKVTVKFQISPTCDFPQLIADLVSNLGLKVDEPGSGTDMLLRAWDSAVAWQLTLKRPEKPKSVTQDKEQSVDINTPEGDFCVLLFRSLISSDKPEIEFMKSGSFNSTEIDAIISSLQLAGGRLATPERQRSQGATRAPSAEKSVSALESMGVKIYGLNEPLANSSKTDIYWDNIAGYDQQKREIEDTILLALHSPEVYDDIARGTRQKFESNRPRAVLFEGPPGTGKTSCARVVANQAGVPLLYVPLEIVVSKYYGESERLLGKVFSLADDLPNGAIIFLDEVDAFAISRDTEMHEATRRILSVLLRQIDGFEQEKKVVVVAATNRKQDLDPALISRFDAMITFGLPDQLNRQKIIAQYAKHLTDSDSEEFAKVAEGMSGRDIRDVCQQAERSWASKIIRGQAVQEGERTRLPPLSEYLESAVNRQKAIASVAGKVNGTFNSPMQRRQMDLC